MDPKDQRLQIAQDFCQQLLLLLGLPLRAQQSQVQSAIDQANARLAALASMETAPVAPFVPPQFVPVPTQTAPSTVTPAT